MLVPKEKRFPDDDWSESEWQTRCTCRACEENWPLFDDLQTFEVSSNYSDVLLASEAIFVLEQMQEQVFFCITM